MKVRIVALAVLVAVSPAIAGAQDDGTARWTLGAGVAGVSEIIFIGPPSIAVSSPLSSSVPLATLSLERRLAEKLWLVIAMDGSAQRDEFDPPPADTLVFTSVTESRAERASFSVGVRRVVTGPGAIVDLSLLATAGGGYLHFREEFVRGGDVGELEDTGAFARVQTGIAVERALTGALALRISSPILGATWSRLEREENGSTRDGSSVGVTVGIAPRIELRLAF